MCDYIIQSKRLSKVFGDNVALNHIDIKIPKGKIFGLLGPNGAGKTTLIRIITQILDPDDGHVFFNGQPISFPNIYDIGYMPEERGLYKKMKVGEQLIYLARLKNLPLKTARKTVNFWLDRLNISHWWGKKVEELSKGMQQKIQFIVAVMHDPILLILDEPFSGLDPVNTKMIKHEIAELHAKGVSIIFATHRMEQVEEICEEIVLINNGNIILDGSVMQIRENFKRNHYVIQYEGSVEREQVPSAFNLIDFGKNHLTFELTQGQNANTLIRTLLNKKIEIHGVKEILPSLNEIFIQQVEEENGLLIS